MTLDTVEKQYIYFCMLDEWRDWMDGVLESQNSSELYDFVSEEVDSEDKAFCRLTPSYTHVLKPFSEAEAKKHFLNAGYGNVRIVYPNDIFKTD